MRDQVMLSKKTFLAATLGTLLEQYDFVLFSSFLPILAPLFFPDASFFGSLLKSYYFLFASMLARPIGGIIFGHIGDFSGRRKALLISINCITMSTILIGCTPTYEAIGIWATIIILVARIIQMLCFGGEYNGAGIYIVEHAKQRNEALCGSLLTAIMLSGALIASVNGIIITLPVMPSWSWRLAFLFAGILGLIGIKYRNHFTESPDFKHNTSQEYHLRHLVKHSSKKLLAAIFIGGFATVPYTTVMMFILPLLMAKGNLTIHQFMLAQSGLIILCMVTLILAGKLADQTSPNNIIQWGAILLIFLAYPLMKIVDLGNTWFTLFALASLLIMNEMVLGPSNAYLKNLFIIQFRYRGSSLGFCLGMAFLGGLTPIIEYKLHQQTGCFSSIAIWLIFIGLGLLLMLRTVAKENIDYPNYCIDV
jgi:MFS family permease